MTKISLDDYDIESLISYEGFDYRLTSGSSGPQINVKDCPNCRSSTWKVYFNADTGLGNCFKCSKRFNKFSFIKSCRNFKYNTEVFNYLTSLGTACVYIPKVKKTSNTQPNLNKDWKFPLNVKITTDEHLVGYLKKRNINLKIAERFDLRVCYNGFYCYKNFKGNPNAVDFSNRIIIPIKDIDGNVVTFQGRDMLGSAEKKYLFPNMLPATGAYIYNADYALKNNFKKIILNEGVFDVFATTLAIESDVTLSNYCACGTFGKHLGIDTNGVSSRDQLKDLFALRENGVDEFVIMWDGEPKAIKAAIETGLKLLNYGFNVKVAKLPLNLDPEEAGREAVIKALNEAEVVTKLSLVRYRISNEK